MPDFVLDANLSIDSYAISPSVVDGWSPVPLTKQQFDVERPNPQFGAYLYEKNGPLICAKMTWRDWMRSLLLVWIVGLCVGVTPAYSQASEKCPDGRYTGRATSVGETYSKDHYTWAVTREFAVRFCMPEEFISDDLKGAEAIAYWHGKPTGQEVCRVEGGKEVCRQSKYGHWIELYVKTGVLPRYDSEVRFFIRDVQSSNAVLGTPQRGRILLQQKLQSDAIKRGEIPWPLGMRPPFSSRGYLPDSSGVVFSLLARSGTNQVEVRPAALVEKFYQQNWNESLDIVALEGWSNGSIAGRQYPDPPPYGYALGIRLESSRDAHNHYPDAYQHIIELPRRVIELIVTNDQASGAAFEGAVRSVVDSMRK